MVLPKAVLFDLGDTVLVEARVDTRAGTRRLLEFARQPCHVTVDEVESRAREVTTDVSARQRDGWIEMPIEAYQRLIYEPLGVEFDAPSEALVREFWDATVTMKPAPGVVELLELLRRDGVLTALISNTSFSEQVLAAELSKHGLLDYFRFIISSADYGLRKPHPALYRIASIKLGIRPRNIWFIGDNLECDIAGANAAGMVSVWYNPQDTPARDDIVPRHTIRHYCELMAMLER